jgi:Tol biopolymer transport system component
LQHREDECFYVLEGRFEFVVEDAGVEAVPGDLVYASRGELHSFEKYSIETVRTDGTGRKYVTTGYAPNWSPDGGKMTFHRSPDGGDSAIYTADAGGMDEEPLTGNGTDFDADPAYAPGGGRIVFSSNRDGDYDLYIMDADGTDVRQLTNAPGSDVAPDWRPVQ